MFVKIVDGVNKWSIIKNSRKGTNARKETALFVAVVYLFKE